MPHDVSVPRRIDRDRLPFFVGGILSLALAGAIHAQNDYGTSFEANTDGEETTLSESAPTHSNRLIDSTSQYLLQHAHNPVDWMPWGQEAFDLARELDKPIFLSVGYSTCYWCHVMEREVFENEDIAAIMNRDFVCVKVDREQRPDVDELYMMATQIFSGHGGWPNSVFLTPDLKPFYCGTYFGAEDMPGGRPGFPRVLGAIANAWAHQRDAIEKQATDLAMRVSTYLGAESQTPVDVLSATIVDRAIDDLSRTFDDAHGGWGIAPKFPGETNFTLLARVYRRTKDASLLDMARVSLTRMYEGTIHDQVGGGFHRYATDQEWRVPHFEKMLYNQALLSIAFTTWHAETRDELYEDAVRRALAFVQSHMTSPEGGFYSALDAETDATEGKFYLWTEEELEAVLGDVDSKRYREIFELAPVPKIPGHAHAPGGGVFWRESVASVATTGEKSVAALLDDLRPLQSRLDAARSKREHPLLDTKIISAWNGMMILAFVEAAIVLEDQSYAESAIRAGEFARSNLTQSDGKLWRVWREGVGEIDAFHDDYAWMTRAYIALFRLTQDRAWLNQAVALQGLQDSLFWDEAGGGYYFADLRPDLFARTKSPNEGALPSGNAVALHNLLDLHALIGDNRFLARADEILLSFGALLDRNPGAYVHMAEGLEKRREIPMPIGKVNRRPDDFIDRPGADTGFGGVAHAPAAAGSPVRLSARPAVASVRPGQRFGLTVTLQMKEGWHVNSSEPRQANLIPTLVDLRSDTGVKVVEMNAPTPTSIVTAYEDEEISVFEGAVEFKAVLQAPPESPEGGRHVIRVVYQYQPCNDTSCLAAVTGAIEVAVGSEAAVGR